MQIDIRSFKNSAKASQSLEKELGHQKWPTWKTFKRCPKVRKECKKNNGNEENWTSKK